MFIFVDYNTDFKSDFLRLFVFPYVVEFLPKARVSSVRRAQGVRPTTRPAIEIYKKMPDKAVN